MVVEGLTRMIRQEHRENVIFAIQQKSTFSLSSFRFLYDIYLFEIERAATACQFPVFFERQTVATTVTIHSEIGSANHTPLMPQKMGRV